MLVKVFTAYTKHIQLVDMSYVWSLYVILILEREKVILRKLGANNPDVVDLQLDICTVIFSLALAISI